MQRLHYIDLFCGAGGTTTGIEDAHIDGVKCADVERDAVREIFAGLRDEGRFNISTGKDGTTIARTIAHPSQNRQQPLI